MPSNESEQFYHYGHKHKFDRVRKNNVISKSTKKVYKGQKGVYVTQLSPFDHTKQEILKNNYGKAQNGRAHSADYVFEFNVPNDQAGAFVDAGSKTRDVSLYRGKDLPLEGKYDVKGYKVRKYMKPCLKCSYSTSQGQKTKTKLKKAGKTIGTRSQQTIVHQKTEYGLFHNTTITKEETVQKTKYKDPIKKTKKKTTTNKTKTDRELNDASKAGVSAVIQSLAQDTTDLILQKKTLKDWFKGIIPNAMKAGFIGYLLGAVLSYIDKMTVFGQLLRFFLAVYNLIEQYMKTGKVKWEKQIINMLMEIILTIGIDVMFPGMGWIGREIVKGIGFSVFDSVFSWLF